PVLIIVDRGIQNRNRFERLIVLWIILQDDLVGLDSVFCFLNVIGRIDAGLVLLVDDAGDKNRRRFVGWIQRERATSMQLGVFEVPFFVGLRCFVQFVLGPHLGNQGAAGAGSNK